MRSMRKNGNLEDVIRAWHNIPAIDSAGLHMQTPNGSLSFGDHPTPKVSAKSVVQIASPPLFSYRTPVAMKVYNINYGQKQRYLLHYPNDSPTTNRHIHLINKKLRAPSKIMHVNVDRYESMCDMSKMRIDLMFDEITLKLKQTKRARVHTNYHFEEAKNLFENLQRIIEFFELPDLFPEELHDFEDYHIARKLQSRLNRGD